MSLSTKSDAGPTAHSKRRRIDDQSLVEDPDLWMSDGNIIVAAADDSNDDKVTYGFRVHQSVLSKHSLIFKDMFTLPQAADSEQYGNLPVVKLTDPYRDVRGLLQMLYDPTIVPLARNPLWKWKEDLDIIEGPLRLCAKYELTSLYKRLVLILETHWPQVMDKWAKRKQTLEMWQESNRWCQMDGGKLRKIPDPIRAINLAYDAGVSSVLPMAFYELHVSLSLSPPRSENEPLMSAPAEKYDALAAPLMERLASLEQTYCSQLMQGRIWLQLATTTLSSRIFPNEIYGHCLKACYKRDSGTTRTIGIGCSSKVKKWWDATFVTEQTSRQFLNDPIAALHDVSMTLEYGNQYDICAGCTGRIRQVLHACGEYIWGELRFFFGISAREEGRLYGYENYIIASVDSEVESD